MQTSNPIEARCVDEAAPGVALEDSACPLHCPPGDVPVLTGRDLIHGLPGEYTIVRCRTCGLMRTNPRPTPEAMGFYYPDDYGPYMGTQVAPDAPRRKRYAGLRKAISRLFEFNTSRMPPMATGRMLEIGCASGAFLHEMAKKGWQVEGIEFSKTAGAAAARLGYTVHVGTVEDAPAPAQPFDLVVGWMVLEHLHQPMMALEKLRAWTKPNGWLVLAIPNAGSWDRAVFKDKWYALHLPNHLYHYTKKTIGLVLAATGWRLDRVHFQRTLVDPVASLGYVLRERGMREVGETLLRFPEYPGYWMYGLYPLAVIAAALGQTGRMTIWARNSP